MATPLQTLESCVKVNEEVMEMWDEERTAALARGDLKRVDHCRGKYEDLFHENENESLRRDIAKMKKG
jgi:hypothetical protein